MKKILGMGNALVDIMIPVGDEQVLGTLGLPKGSMQLVDREQSNHVLTTLKDYRKSHSAGGSAANTIHGLAMLGAATGYIGVVGEDDLGGFFVRDLIKAGVEPHLIHSEQETGRAIALVTPDSERTFATFLGAAIELSSSLVTDHASLFSSYSIFHIEGYLVQNHDLIRTAVKLAKENGLKVSVDLASYNVVEANRDFLLEIISGYADIVFANEEEAKALTGLDPGEALHAIGEMAEIAVVKTGRNGSLVKSAGEVIPIGVIDVTPVDTTGAGDLYASGFLYGLSRGMPLQRCGELGAVLAGNVIEFVGAKMPDDRWREIRGHLVTF